MTYDFRQASLDSNSVKALRKLLQLPVKWSGAPRIYQDLNNQGYVEMWRDQYRLSDTGIDALQGLKLTRKEQMQLEAFRGTGLDLVMKQRLRGILRNKMRPEDAARELGVSIDDLRRLIRKHFP